MSTQHSHPLVRMWLVWNMYATAAAFAWGGIALFLRVPLGGWILPYAAASVASIGWLGYFGAHALRRMNSATKEATAAGSPETRPIAGKATSSAARQ